MIRADLLDGRLSDIVTGCPKAECDCGGRHTLPHGERVVLTAWPSGHCGVKGWTFQQTGTHESGYPEGVAVAEPASLLDFKKRRVVELEKSKAAIAAAAASTGWDYSAELAAIDSEIESLK